MRLLVENLEILLSRFLLNWDFFMWSHHERAHYQNDLFYNISISHLSGIINNIFVPLHRGFGVSSRTGRELYITIVIAADLALLGGNRIHFRFCCQSFDIDETTRTTTNQRISFFQ